MLNMGRRTQVTHQVQDGARTITFEGELLAEVNSRTDERVRWIELRLFRTVAGTYVLAGCGRTVVTGEVDRPWVQLAEEPEGIIDRLYMLSDEGARYMPHTSRRLLEVAAKRDSEIHSAYWREHIA